MHRAESLSKPVQHPAACFPQPCGSIRSGRCRRRCGHSLRIDPQILCQPQRAANMIVAGDDHRRAQFQRIHNFLCIFQVLLCIARAAFCKNSFLRHAVFQKKHPHDRTFRRRLVSSPAAAGNDHCCFISTPQLKGAAAALFQRSGHVPVRPDLRTRHNDALRGHRLIDPSRAETNRSDNSHRRCHSQCRQRSNQPKDPIHRPITFPCFFTYTKFLRSISLS